MQRTILALISLGVAGMPAAAQDQTRPATWVVRLDQGPAGAIPDSLFYVGMPPGWHITSGPHSGIFYDPAWRASGGFRLSATIFLFPDSRQEGYGIFFGGTGLDGPDQSYIYLLLRRDGKYLLKHRRGSEAREIVPWTTHPAIAALGAGASGDVKNVIDLEVNATTMILTVNGRAVGTWPRGELANRGEGQVGLRVNRGVNLHVSELRIAPIG